ncbi:hypothetical protein BKA70DRAFT_1257111 [Coprinopsis sp. MPI-PUGE-AT-0042]|nr:hypothetical protein BKA70DRAFT_1257111 [Coprinopsis sp. MPI-PUGE-AT-0042]
MKFSTLFGVLALGSLSVQAQYFSEGWTPGQDAQPSAEPDIVYNPGEPLQTPPQATPESQPQAKTTEAAVEPTKKSIFDYLDPDRLLGLALDKMGFNITAKMEEKTWDQRIPLITDDNYEELILNEEFASEQESADRVWAIVVTVSGSKVEPLSKLVDDMFDSAYKKTLEAGDLPHVRWGRIDYFKVTYLTTKWNVWKAPYLILLKDKGQTLHFFSPAQIRIQDDALRDFLKTEGYQSLTPWTGIWAPGGEREWLLDLFARYMAKMYNNFTKVPRWIMFIATGAIGSFILSFLHKPSNQSVLTRTTTASDSSTRDATTKGPAASSAASSSTPSKNATGVKQRRRKDN